MEDKGLLTLRCWWTVQAPGCASPAPHDTDTTETDMLCDWLAAQKCVLVALDIYCI